MQEKENFIETRKGIVHFAELSLEEQKELIQKDSAYGQVICRCETVTEGEILDAIRRPLGARTLDGLKRRVRAGMDDAREDSVHRGLWRYCPESVEFRWKKSVKIIRIPESL